MHIDVFLKVERFKVIKSCALNHKFPLVGVVHYGALISQASQLPPLRNLRFIVATFHYIFR